MRKNLKVLCAACLISCMCFGVTAQAYSGSDSDSAIVGAGIAYATLQFDDTKAVGVSSTYDGVPLSECSCEVTYHYGFGTEEFRVTQTGYRENAPISVSVYSEHYGSVGFGASSNHMVRRDNVTGTFCLSAGKV